jgi:hypothetical protein
MSFYLWMHPEYAKSVAHTQTTVLFEAVKQAGGRVLLGDDINVASPGPDDCIVTYGNVEGWAPSYSRFAPHNRWSYVMDEQGPLCKGPYLRCIGYMQRLGCTGAVSVYSNPQKLQAFHDAGIRVATLPHCVMSVRPMTAKVADIVVSGAQDPSYYPTRARLTGLFRKHLPRHVSTLRHVGLDTRGSSTMVDDAYLAHLGGHRLGVVCRAGWHDRFVGKYVEYGAARVLPVGDCPSYMPAAMKRAMLDVEHMSDDGVLHEVRRLLADPVELQQRTDAYVAEVERGYLALPNVQRLIREITA